MSTIYPEGVSQTHKLFDPVKTFQSNKMLTLTPKIYIALLSFPLVVLSNVINTTPSTNVNHSSIITTRGDHLPDFSFSGYHSSENPPLRTPNPHPNPLARRPNSQNPRNTRQDFFHRRWWWDPRSLLGNLRPPRSAKNRE